MPIETDLLRERLLAALAVPSWADRVVVGAPYDDVDALVDAATAAATPLTAADIAEALGAHPRIGERRDGDDAEARFSRAEQAASADSDDSSAAETLARLLAVGNAAYERRFDRIFLIRAAGRSRAEILAELIRRLADDEATELDEVGEQLRQIMTLRLRAMFAADTAEVPA